MNSWNLQEFDLLETCVKTAHTARMENYIPTPMSVGKLYARKYWIIIISQKFCMLQTKQNI